MRKRKIEITADRSGHFFVVIDMNGDWYYLIFNQRLVEVERVGPFRSQEHARLQAEMNRARVNHSLAAKARVAKIRMEGRVASQQRKTIKLTRLLPTVQVLWERGDFGEPQYYKAFSASRASFLILKTNSLSDPADVPVPVWFSERRVSGMVLLIFYYADKYWLYGHTGWVHAEAGELRLELVSAVTPPFMRSL